LTALLLGMVVHICNPYYLECGGRMLTVGEKMRDSILKTKYEL
jgi:hypothetical protein